MNIKDCFIVMLIYHLINFNLDKTFRSLSFQFRIGERTISLIAEETCRALYIALKEQYLIVCFFNTTLMIKTKSGI